MSIAIWIIAVCQAIIAGSLIVDQLVEVWRARHRPQLLFPAQPDPAWAERQRKADETQATMDRLMELQVEAMEELRKKQKPWEDPE